MCERGRECAQREREEERDDRMQERFVKDGGRALYTRARCHFTGINCADPGIVRLFVILI